MMSVSDIGLSSELELITFSFGIGTIFALFHTSGTFPTFRDTLNISVIAGANQLRMSSRTNMVDRPGQTMNASVFLGSYRQYR